MIDSDLEKRLERMYAGYVRLPVDTDVSWRRFIRLRRRAAIRRRAVAAGAAVATVVAAAVATAFAYRGNSAGPTVGRHVNHPAPVGRLAITARIPQPGAGSAPGDLAIVGEIVGERNAVWGVSYGDNLFKIDQRTNRVTIREHIAGLTDIAAGGGSIWAVTAHGKAPGRLLAIDPLNGSVTRAFPLPRVCGRVFYAYELQMYYAGGQLWLGCGHPAVDFIRLNPATGHVIAATGKLYGVTSAAASPNGIWYVGHSGVAGFIGSGRRLRWVHVDDAAYPVSMTLTNSLVYGMGALWAFTNDESIAKIDPMTGRIVRIYGYQTYDPSYSQGLGFGAVGLGSLWFVADEGSQHTGVLRVSPATGLVQARASRIGSCEMPCWQIYVAGGSVWVPVQTYITRIYPVSPRRPLRRGSR